MDLLKAKRQTKRSDRRICVVGAGPCGLTTLKNLIAAGLNNIVCYDEGSAIGGNWVFHEGPERGSVYNATHLISSKRLSEFEDFPMPPDYPDYPSHRLVRAYFESYAAQFGLMPMIELQTRVEGASLRPDGRWVASVSNPEGIRQEVFDDLIVCSGHHRDPFMPDVPGAFSGEMLHARDYRRAEPFRGKRVLVVGGGNSACDIAVDISRVASQTCISMRRGYHFVPKLMFGRPTDVQYARARRLRLPKSWLQFLIGALVRLNVGELERYGLQPPTGRWFEMHPTVSSDILVALREGRVSPRSGIERLGGNAVSFRDGRSEPFDVIVWATGYRESFSFLDKTVVDWEPADQPPLFLRMMHRRIPNLFFIGLFQPIGCIWRLADHQARIAALQIAGRLQRPADIEARIADQVSSPHWRFDKSPRHGLEVDYHDFRAELLKELADAAPLMAGSGATAAAEINQ
jgi:cation diffusion facilitator CzcD-associated flavoprotein CzcO